MLFPIFYKFILEHLELWQWCMKQQSLPLYIHLCVSHLSKKFKSLQCIVWCACCRWNHTIRLQVSSQKLWKEICPQDKEYKVYLSGSGSHFLIHFLTKYVISIISIINICHSTLYPTFVKLIMSNVFISVGRFSERFWGGGGTVWGGNYTWSPPVRFDRSGTCCV